MIKIRVYDRKTQKTICFFTKMNSYEYYRKYCCGNRFIFLAWSSKKNNYECWHYSVGLRY